MPPGASPRRLPWMAAAAVLLTLYYVMAVSAVSQKSMTFDEMAHLTGGYTYWAFNDYRLHPENGNWPQRLGALPAIVSGASFPRLDQPAWTGANVYVIGDQFLYSSGNDADTVLGHGRMLMALVGVMLGALVYAWATRLISPAGGTVSLTLFVFSPTLLAHGPLVTSDTMAALFFTAAVGALWTMLQRMTPATVLGSAVLVAGTFLSKLSGPILVPIAAAMVAVRLVPARTLPVRVGRRTFRSMAASGSWRYLPRRRSSLAWWRGRLSGHPLAFATARSTPRPAKTRFSGRSPTSLDSADGCWRPHVSFTCCQRRTSMASDSPCSSHPSERRS